MNPRRIQNFQTKPKILLSKFISSFRDSNPLLLEPQLCLKKSTTEKMPFKTMIEVEQPSLLKYIIKVAIMMIGMVLPVGYMIFRNKRIPSASSYSKQK
ncbi:uncharacterized protein LOC111288709 isoform X2 [Durio zibethinus]|nr:uncharacterized protein LOC111288709 isoform X2 [Durio zibethinus]